MSNHRRWMAISAATGLVFFLVANFSRFLIGLNIVSGLIQIGLNIFVFLTEIYDEFSPSTRSRSQPCQWGRPGIGRSIPESPYQRPQVVRSLYEAATALERVERFERRKAQMPAKTDESWSEDEDRKLLAAFDAGRAPQELAAAHERTIGAVRARLLKCGRINA